MHLSHIKNHKRSYLADFNALKSQFDASKGHISLENSSIEIHAVPFQSKSELIFPNDKQYYAPTLCGSSLNLNSILFEGELKKIIEISDDEIWDNKKFQYILFKHRSPQKAKGVVILFHGLNEKEWTKYLPWAKMICELTGKAVLLFPIAFHINRAYNHWHNARMMQVLSQTRITLFRDLRESAFTNAAMSTRLHFAPSRFFFSGLETYSDIIELVWQIKKNQNPFLEAEAQVDFLGYSAGAFLTQILLMANRDELFSGSKAVLFCGGALLSRMYLTSRYIMDNEAHRAIKDFYVDNFEKHLQNDIQLHQLFEATKKGGLYFKSMLSENDTAINTIRKKRFEELNQQFLAITLEKDTVMTPHEIQASVMNDKGSIAFPCKTFDFQHNYSHVNPFSNTEKNAYEVNESFELIFAEIAHFLA